MKKVYAIYDYTSSCYFNGRIINCWVLYVETAYRFYTPEEAEKCIEEDSLEYCTVVSFYVND
jgi:hypothetical protein